MEELSLRVEDERATAAYGTRAVLDPTTLDSIREANLAFLALLAPPRDPGPSAAAYGLDAGTIAAVARLDPFARRVVASLPYTLFNARFEDPGFWNAVIRDAARPGSASLSDEATFARTAVFLAWHLVHCEELTSAMVLGMGPAVADTWRRLPLSAIDSAATRALPVLRARWVDHPRFWMKLPATGRPGARPGNVALRDLGLQLLAAQGLAPVRAVAEAD